MTTVMRIQQRSALNRCKLYAQEDGFAVEALVPRMCEETDSAPSDFSHV
jgi:hypothetical protein